MLVDSCIFFNEVELLRLRLMHQLQCYDRIVVCESTKTFTGKPRHPVLWDLLREDPRFSFLASDLSRIDVIVFHSESPPESPWDYERLQRNFLSDYIRENYEEAIVYGSDLDEIPSTTLTHRAAANLEKDPLGLVAPSYWMCFFSPNYVKIWGPETESRGPVFYVPKFQTDGLEELRATSKKLAFASPDPLFQLQGWHLSYMGSDDEVSQKLTAFSHQERVVQEASHSRWEHFSRGSAPYDKIEDALCAALVPAQLEFPSCWMVDSWFLSKLLNPKDDAICSLREVIVKLNWARKKGKNRGWLYKVLYGQRY